MNSAKPVLTVLLSSSESEIHAARGRGGNLVVLHPNDFKDDNVSHRWSAAPPPVSAQCVACGAAFESLALIGTLKRCCVLVTRGAESLALHMECYEARVKKRKTKLP